MLVGATMLHAPEPRYPFCTVTIGCSTPLDFNWVILFYFFFAIILHPSFQSRSWSSVTTKDLYQDYLSGIGADLSGSAFDLISSAAILT